MPVMSCNENGKSGWKFGVSGKCYTYPTGNEKASGKAKQKAYLQGIAIGGGKLTEKNNFTEVEIENMDDVEVSMEIFLLESKL